MISTIWFYALNFCRQFSLEGGLVYAAPGSILFSNFSELTESVRFLYTKVYAFYTLTVERLPHINKSLSSATAERAIATLLTGALFGPNGASPDIGRKRCRLRQLNLEKGEGSPSETAKTSKGGNLPVSRRQPSFTLGDQELLACL